MIANNNNCEKKVKNPPEKKAKKQLERESKEYLFPKLSKRMVKVKIGDFLYS